MKDAQLPGPAYDPTFGNALKSAAERFPDRCETPDGDLHASPSKG